MEGGYRTISVRHLLNLAGCWIATAGVTIGSMYLAHTHGYRSFVDFMTFYGLALAGALFLLGQLEKAYLLKSPYGRLVRGGVAWLSIPITVIVVIKKAMGVGAAVVLKAMVVALVFLIPWGFFSGLLLLVDVEEEEPPKVVRDIAHGVFLLGMLIWGAIILKYF
ncbi:MAG: hypothetical protein ACK4SY_08205 [Pyrobaculum sp.]